MKILEEESFDPKNFHIEFIGNIENFDILNILVQDTNKSSSKKLKKEERLIFNIFFRKDKKLIERILDIINLIKGKFSFYIRYLDYEFKFIDFYGENVFLKEDILDLGNIIIRNKNRSYKLSKFEKTKML